MTQLIELRTNGIKKCTIKFEKGDEGPDTASMIIGIEKKACYLNHEMFGYFSKKNIVDYQVKVEKYELKKLNDLDKYLKATMVGNQFKFNKWAS